MEKISKVQEVIVEETPIVTEDVFVATDFSLTRPNEWSVNQLSKRFGGTQALDSVDLAFPAGSVTGILGENGAGKSTLLSMLGGWLTPSSGEIRGDDQRHIFRAPKDSREMGIAVVPQEPVIIGALSIAENIFLGSMPRRFGFSRRKEVTKQADQLVESLGFSVLFDTTRSAKDLSSAGKQLVEILRAVVTQPALLALDEPTTALDTEQVDGLMGLVESLRQQGTAVIYVTHRLAELERIASRIVVLRDGKLVAVHEQRLANAQVSGILAEMTGHSFDAVERKSRNSDGPVSIVASHVSTRKLRNVSIEVHSGEILGVAGLAGSGRTELAKVLAGLSRLRGGTLEIEGRLTIGGGRFNPTKSGVVFISEDRHGEGLLLSRTIRENVSVGALKFVSRAGFVSRQDEEGLAKRLVEELKIKCNSVEMLVSALSGGNQQKVVIARSLAAGARVWILDEPTKGVDIGAKNSIYGLLETRIDIGDTVVFVSSEIPELLTLADRILVMRDGEISGVFDGDSATEEQILGAMFHMAEQ